VVSAATSSGAILMPTAFSRFRMTLQNVTVNTAGASLALRFSSDGGATFLATTNYTGFGILAGSSSVIQKYVLSSQAQILLSTTLPAGGSNKWNGSYEVWGGDAGTLAGVNCNGAQGVNNTGPEQQFGTYSGIWGGTAAAMNALLILCPDGTSQLTGTIVLEGQV
jgi:hypothetical protein